MQHGVKMGSRKSNSRVAHPSDHSLTSVSQWSKSDEKDDRDAKAQPAHDDITDSLDFYAHAHPCCRVTTLRRSCAAAEKRSRAETREIPSIGFTRPGNFVYCRTSSSHIHSTTISVRSTMHLRSHPRTGAAASRTIPPTSLPPSTKRANRSMSFTPSEPPDSVA